jgi:hypothetical protein
MAARRTYRKRPIVLMEQFAGFLIALSSYRRVLGHEAREQTQTANQRPGLHAPETLLRERSPPNSLMPALLLLLF